MRHSISTCNVTYAGHFGRTLRGRSTNCQESSTDGSRKSKRKRRDAMRNALQKHAYGGLSIIRERDPRPERTTTTAGTPQRRSTDRRESNAKTVARTKGRKASPARYRERGRQRSPFGKLTIWDMVTAKPPPHGKRKKRGAHAEERGGPGRMRRRRAHEGARRERRLIRPNPDR